MPNHTAPLRHVPHDRIINGDCLHVLRTIPSDSIDLIVTSPPYGKQRTATYGGVKPADYIDWFLPRAAEFQRVLRPAGTFILNIKEHAQAGERHPYVIKLVLALRDQGWLWTEEFIWHKKNCYPGKWPNRFRDAWEHCYQFNREKQFYMDQDAVMVPVGDWANSRLKNLSQTDHHRDQSNTSSKFAKRISNWKSRNYVYPTNVLHLATECSNKAHSAAFPVSLPTWFIKLFCPPGGVVLDPFVGSGTTCVAAKEVQRHYIGIDSSADFCARARTRLSNTSPATHKAA